MKKLLALLALSITLSYVEAAEKKTEHEKHKKTHAKKKDKKEKSETKRKREEKHTKTEHQRAKTTKSTGFGDFFGGNKGGDKATGRTHDGRTIYEGPRGGHYYYTASGNKEYV